jgi:hypothetical protein
VTLGFQFELEAERRSVLTSAWGVVTVTTALAIAAASWGVIMALSPLRADSLHDEASLVRRLLHRLFHGVDCELLQDPVLGSVCVELNTSKPSGGAERPVRDAGAVEPRDRRQLFLSPRTIDFHHETCSPSSASAGARSWAASPSIRQPFLIAVTRRFRRCELVGLRLA